MNRLSRVALLALLPLTLAPVENEITITNPPPRSPEGNIELIQPGQELDPSAIDGFVDPNLVTFVVAQSDCGVLPSGAEKWSWSMAAGVPMIYPNDAILCKTSFPSVPMTRTVSAKWTPFKHYCPSGQYPDRSTAFPWDSATCYACPKEYKGPTAYTTGNVCKRDPFERKSTGHWVKK